MAQTSYSSTTYFDRNRHQRDRHSWTVTTYDAAVTTRLRCAHAEGAETRYFKTRHASTYCNVSVNSLSMSLLKMNAQLILEHAESYRPKGYRSLLLNLVHLSTHKVFNSVRWRVFSTTDHTLQQAQLPVCLQYCNIPVYGPCGTAFCVQKVSGTAQSCST